MTAMAPTADLPVAVQDFWQPRRAAFWTMVILLAWGAVTIGDLTLDEYSDYPVATGVGIVVWALYAVPLFLLIRWLDLYAQNSWIGMALAGMYGALAATAIALRANAGLDGVLTELWGSDFVADWGPAVEGPITEEPAKLLGVVLLVLIARTRFRTILPAMFLGALVGLGFQVSEDLIYTVNAAASWTGDSESDAVLSTFIVRGLLTGMFSHAAYTAIAAFGVGYFVSRKDESIGRRLSIATAAVLAAMGLHFLWNSPILSDATALLVIAIKGLPVVVAVVLMWRVAVNEESQVLQSLAEVNVDPELITERERMTLGRLRERRKVRKRAKKAGGRDLEHRVTRLQREQMRLLVAIYQEGPDTPRVRRHEEAIRRYRAEIDPGELDSAYSAGQI
jgi:RsiW-degrading membrane proteinase PrsW (M82 family)